jgi:hypothetical protein
MRATLGLLSAIFLALSARAQTNAAPLSPEDIPPIGNFYSAQNPDLPPLPGNFAGLPAWDMGNGNYLVDDIDYSPDGGRIHAMLSGPPGLPGGGGGGGSGGVLPLWKPDFTTNELWLQIIGSRIIRPRL